MNPESLTVQSVTTAIAQYWLYEYTVCPKKMRLS